MQFKVGDRVEAIKPPINLEKSDPDEVGIGVIKEVNPRPFDGAYLVKLDSGPEWAYWESYLRPAPIATPTLRGPQEKTLSERILEAVDTDWQERHVRKLLEKRKSITVGTQVRLTGVVEPDPAEGGGGIYLRTAGRHSVYLNSSAKEDLEVIRQPFKRGEVVWSCGAVATGEQYVVFNDETNGRVDVVHCDTGTATKGNDASRFERRP